MALRPLLALTSVVALCACAAVRTPREVEVPFQCEDGRRFTAVFARNPDTALLRIEGRELLLPGTASGYRRPARYSDGRNSLHGSGLEATLEIEGMPAARGCVRGAELAPSRPRRPGR